jgi:hypothetical protein
MRTSARPWVNNLQAVGIRSKLGPLERAAFFKGYAERIYRNLIQGQSGAFGIAATRLEAFVAKGGAVVNFATEWIRGGPRCAAGSTRAWH